MNIQELTRELKDYYDHNHGYYQKVDNTDIWAFVAKNKHMAYKKFVELDKKKNEITKRLILDIQMMKQN